jgi:hypothetical protein
VTNLFYRVGLGLQWICIRGSGSGSLPKSSGSLTLFKNLQGLANSQPVRYYGKQWLLTSGICGGFGLRVASLSANLNIQSWTNGPYP